jgi:hypothetical protein
LGDVAPKRPIQAGGLALSLQNNFDPNLRVTRAPIGVTVGVLEQPALSELDGAGLLSAQFRHQANAN